MSYQRNHSNHQPYKRNQRQSLNRQRGVVIVVALFIVALVAAMAYVMLARSERDTYRTSLIVRNTQAEFYAQGSIAWAIDQLRNNWEHRKPNQLVDKTPIKSAPMTVDGYQISSTIYDMQGRYNLNMLHNDTDSQVGFKRLLQAVDPKLSEEDARAITMATLDWLNQMGSLNQLSSYYLGLPAPYRAAHRPMVSVSELRLVKGMTPSLYSALQPYVTALPAPTPINVYSAPAPVLMTLSSTMTLDAATAIEQVRAQNSLVTPEQFLKLDVVTNQQINPNNITTISDYFLVETDVTIENQHIVLYTLLERTTVKVDKATVNILWQSKGIW